MTQRKFRPSQANYWGNCAAFQRFTADLPPQPSGDAAREGTCAAWVAEVVLNGDASSCADMLGETHANGWQVGETMCDDVQDYVNLVRSFGGTVRAEKHVRASENPLIEGTLDAIVVTPYVLHVIDLKYGRRTVEARGNKQLICYAAGAWPTITFDEIHLSIYQPRSFHRDGIFRTWKLTPDQLQAEFAKLHAAAVESEKPDSVATPGPHCRDCEAAAGCVALAETTYNLVDTVTSRDHREMTPIELSRELDFVDDARKTIEARFKAIEAEAAARIKRESIPHWSTVPTTGNRVFTVDPVTAQLLTGVDPSTIGTCTPAALERRGADKEIVKSITKQPVTGHKLTRIDSDYIAGIFNATKGK